MKSTTLKTVILTFIITAILGGGAYKSALATTPEEDLQNFRDFFYKKFPGIPLNEFANGVYAIHEESRETWEAIEEFPPYEIDIEKGEELFNTPFGNGKSYASCFKNNGIGIRQNFPFYSKESRQVKTLEQLINECLSKNGEQVLEWKKGDIASISAYMAYTSRGKTIQIKTPTSADEIK